MMYVGKRDVRVVEFNSKPSQLWDADDPEGQRQIHAFQDAIVNEFARLAG